LAVDTVNGCTAKVEQNRRELAVKQIHRNPFQSLVMRGRRTVKQLVVQLRLFNHGWPSI
jgi:flagellar biosynthesis chaperone FliJ